MGAKQNSQAQASMTSIKQIIRQSYNQREHRLDLHYFYKQWSQVITSQNWSELSILSLWYCQITDEQVQNVSNMDIPNLNELYLWNNYLTNIGIQKLITNPCISNLKILQLSFNPIGNKGVKILTNIKFGNLTELHLDGCGIQNQGIKCLTKLSADRLSVLRIGANRITNVGFFYFTLCHWRYLTLLRTYEGSNMETVEQISRLFLMNLPSTQCAVQLVSDNWRIKMEYIKIIQSRNRQQ